MCNQVVQTLLSNYMGGYCNKDVSELLVSICLGHDLLNPSKSPGGSNKRKKDLVLLE